MNKIYKVIWSKVKHQYVVVSELAHSNGKQSRTSRNSIRSRIAALVVCGAITAFGVYGALPNSVYAENNTKAWQYAAISTEANPDFGEYRDEYHLENVQVNGKSKTYWVRDGYHIDVEQVHRYDSDDTTNVSGTPTPMPVYDDVIRVYRNDDWEESNANGLLSSMKVSNSNMGITTLNGKDLQDITAGTFVGASSGGGTEVPSNYNYLINDNGKWVDAGNEKFKDYFKTVTYDNTLGGYTYNNQLVDPQNVYFIDGQAGVFLVSGVNGEKEVYKGAVYGAYNEILVTGKDSNGNYYSYWGAERTDPNETIGDKLTVGQYNNTISWLNDNIRDIHEDDIKQIQVKATDNGGTIGLQTNGEADSKGNPTGGKNIPGTITIKNPTIDSGTNGKDVKIQFGSIGEDGKTDVAKFTVDAGSKVEGLKDEATAKDGDTLTGLKINGVEYDLSQGKTYSPGQGIAISDDNKISVDKGDGLEFTSNADDAKLEVNANEDKGIIVNSSGVAVNAGEGLAFETEGTDKGKLKVNVGDGLSINGSNQIVNNLKVAKLDDPENKHDNGGNWTITDSKANITLTNTTLDEADSNNYNSDESNLIKGAKNTNYENTKYGRNYKVIDTDGNEVALNDVASADTLKTIDTTKIGNLEYDSITGTEISKNDSVTAAIGKLDNKVNGGWNAVVNGTKINVTPQGNKNTLEFAAGNNVSITPDVENNKITIATDLSDLSADETNAVLYDETNKKSVTLGGTTYDKDDEDTGTRLTNVAYANVNGENTGSDAVNVDLLKDYVDENGGGAWNLTTNGGVGEENTAISVGKGNTVDFSSEDGNVTVAKTTADGKTKLAFGLADELNVNKVTTSNMYVTNVDTTTENKDSSVVNVGYFNTNEKHIATAGEAAYPSDGYKVNKEDDTVTLVEANGNGVATGNSVVINDVASASDLGDLTTKVDNGWTAKVGEQTINVTPKEDGNNTLEFAAGDHVSITPDKDNNKITIATDLSNLSADETNAVLYDETNKKSVTLGNGKNEYVTGTTGTGVKLTNVAYATGDDGSEAVNVDYLEDTVDSINKASYKGWTVSANGETNKVAVPSNGNVDFSNTDGNIIVGQTGTNLTFDLNDNITLGDESGTRIQLNGNPQKDSMISITNKDSDTVFNVAKDGTVHSDGDIVAKADSNKKYSLSEVGENAVRYNENKSTVALAGTNGTTITNVADGDVSEGSKEAVNGSQLYATNQKVDAGWVATDGTNKIEVNPTDSGTTTLNFAGDNNITVTADTTNKAIQVALNDKVYLGGDHTEDSRNIVLDGERGVIGLGSNIALDGRDGTAVIGGVNIDTAYDEATGKPSSTITGLSNTTWTDEIATAAADKKSEAAGTAATQGQLGDVASDLSDQITNSGWTASTNNGAVTTDITNGDKVDFANTDGNIAVNQTAVKDDKGNITGTNLTFDLNPDITLDDDVEDGNSVQLSGTNGTINAHNSELIFGGTGKYDNVNDMTFNQNGLTVTNTQTMRDTGETTTSSTVINGGSIATGNITAGGITVNADNGGTVNGLTNKTWDADNYVSGQAATEDQLKSVSDKVNAGWIATDSQNNEVNITPDNNKLNFAGDENVTVTAANNEIKVALNDDITLKGDSSSIELTGTKGTIQVNQETAEGTNFTNINGNVVSIGYTNSEGIENAIVIDGGKGTITGLSNTTWDDELAKQVANSEELQGTAATQGQLQQAVSEVAEVANAGWNAKAGGNTINVKPNETLNFEGDGNITVSATGGTSNELKFGLNDNITLGDKAGQKTSTSLTLYTDPTLKEVTRIGEDGNPETVKVTGYIPESYIDDQERVDNFISTHGGFMMYATNTSGEGVFGITTDGMVHAKDVISYMPNSDSTSKDKILKYSLNDIGDIVTQIAHGQYDKTGMEYTLISDFSSQADKDKPFQPEEGERTIGLAVREDGAVVVGAVVNEDGYINDSGIRINAEKRVNKDGTTSSDNMATITGLENTEWKPPTPVATLAANDGSATVTSRAATESQLNDLYSAVAAYDVNVDGTIDYSHIALAGTPYGASRAGNGTPTGGTSITNVAYASGNDGSEAVNVDYLNNAIKDAVKDGPVASNEKHLDTSTSYTPNEKGEIAIDELDGTGNKTGNQLVINNVASKDDIKDLNDKVGNVDFSGTNHIDKDTDNLTDAIKDLDSAISDMQGDVTQQVEDNTVSGGHVDKDGNVVLETNKDKNIQTDIKLTDSEVVGGKAENGKLTINKKDNYTGAETSIDIEGVATTDMIGAKDKEDLATAYKDADKDGNATTEYITESGSMVEADVALDHAIQDVANTSYANDMVLSNRIDSVEKRLGNVEERIDKVGAMAAAIANLRTMGFDPEAPTEIAIGVGQYKSETGIAIGVFHYPNQDFMLSASLSSSGDELMGGIGATWKLGRKSAAERAKDEEARHLEQAEEMKKLAQQEKVKAQAQRHAKLLAERQQASQKNA